MGVDIFGVDEAMKELELKFGDKAAKRLTRKALKAGGDVMLEAFEKATAEYSDGSGHSTGATNEAVVEEGVRITNQGASVKVGFSKNDPKERWRLVHLNELGYSAHGVFAGSNNAVHGSDNTAFQKPRGFGKLQDAWDENKGKAIEIQQAKIRKDLGL